MLAAGSNVLVHLKPAPVIARVMTGTAPLHGDIESWLARELAVGAFLGNGVWPSHPAICSHRGPTGTTGSG